MADIDYGGPAFPRPCGENPDDYNDDQRGMTMRDYFAAAALTGMLANSAKEYTFENAAQSAYLMADMMIKARG